MYKYIARRILQMIPTLFVISIVVFSIIQMAPGDAVSGMLDPKMTAEDRARERELMGLDQPIYVQYVRWVGNVFQGDLGESFTRKEPVSTVIKSYIWNTVNINLVISLLIYLIAIPLGIFCAVKYKSRADQVWGVLSVVGMSLPSFVVSMLFIYIFAAGTLLPSLGLSNLPLSGMLEAGSTTTGIDRAKEIGYHMILPVSAMVVSGLAGIMRYTKTSMLNVLKLDYIRTARSKGLKEKVVIYRHAFKNASIPIVGMIPGTIAGLFSGSAIMETIFNWPGIGRVLLESVNTRDYPLNIALLMMFSILVVIANLVADILYALVDPRIKYD